MAIAHHRQRVVLVGSDGQPMRPPTTTHWFGAAVNRCQAADAKFPRVTVHELRHTVASLMIASGAKVKTVQAQGAIKRRR
ncbi:tyrosine-type recombinase/integrase [Mycobacterium sp.]|uniref:tyrosine-type recombinase/integrase n=1 Tax=Mycobacterium sp. TaxID=1785 RepID=UPI0039C982C9